ncbi:MAG: hypothetical protein JXC32_08945 [Anaerolineae bacterium]|nr:hypothetical protein [Anaerolineae bacterium]
MAEKTGGIARLAAQSYTDAKELIGRLFDVATPSAAFGEPVKAGDQIVITASEATVSVGFGFGLGGGDIPTPAVEEGEEGEAPDAESLGGGGGGGGFSSSRPVAVIAVGPEGVRVEPVMDVTKVALAFFTMFGGLIAMTARMRNAGRG